MNFKIEKRYFYDALADLSRSVSQKPNPQILSGIKISVTPEGLTMIVSNHELFIEKFIPNNYDGALTIFEAGSCITPVKHLVELVKKMPGDIIVKLQENNRLNIKTEEINVVLSGFSVEEYPQLPEIIHSKSIELPAGLLYEMVRQTAFAASVNDSRPVLTGMLISFHQDKMRCAATNSHRLAMREIDMATGIEGSYIVPLSSIKEFLRLFDDSKAVALSLSDNYLVFTTEDLTLYTRLIEGTYPNIARLIPSETKTTVTLKSLSLLEAIDRANLFSRESRNNFVKLELDGRKLRIASDSSDLGQIEETQQITGLEGDPQVTLSLNSIFLIEALKSISDEEITLSFSGSMRPVLITPNSDKSHLHLISPVRR